MACLLFLWRHVVFEFGVRLIHLDLLSENVRRASAASIGIPMVVRYQKVLPGLLAALQVR